MSAALDSTDTPFGKVVQPLHFHRSTLSAQLLWSPLPEGWETSPPALAHPGMLVIPHGLLQHQAILISTEGQPFSTVVETYTDEVLSWVHNVPPQR